MSSKRKSEDREVNLKESKLSRVEQELKEENAEAEDMEADMMKKVGLENDNDFISRKFKLILAAVAKPKGLDKKKKLGKKNNDKDIVEENLVDLDSFSDDDIKDETDIDREKVLRSDIKKMEKQIKTTFDKKDRTIAKEKLKVEKLEKAVKEMAKLRKELGSTIKILERKLTEEIQEKETIQNKSEKLELKVEELEKKNGEIEEAMKAKKLDLKVEELEKKNGEMEEAMKAKNKLIEKLIMDLHENKDSHSKASEIEVPKETTDPRPEPHFDRNPVERKVKFNVLIQTRNRFYPTLTVEQMNDTKLFHFMTSQEGCDFLQDKFTKMTPDEVEIVFEIVVFNPFFLITNRNGSILFQRFLEVISEINAKKLMRKLKPNLSKVLFNVIAHKVIADIFGKLSVSTQEIIIHEICKDIIEYCRNSFASLVVQKCIEVGDVMSSLKLKQIILKANEEAEMLCRNKYGSRVIQQILTSAPEELKAPLKATVILMTPELMQHQYGNYIVQNLCSTGTEEDVNRIVGWCRGTVFSMARSKYASNVVQKLLRTGTRRDSMMLMEEVLGKQELDMLVREQYGNYVVQLIVDKAETGLLRELYDKIVPGLDVDIGQTVSGELRNMIMNKSDKEGVVGLAKKYLVNLKEFSAMREGRFKDMVEEIDGWMEDIVNFTRLSVEDKKLPILIEVLDEIGYGEKNCDVDELKQGMKQNLVEFVALQGKRQHFEQKDQQPQYVKHYQAPPHKSVAPQHQPLAPQHQSVAPQHQSVAPQHPPVTQYQPGHHYQPVQHGMQSPTVQPQQVHPSQQPGHQQPIYHQQVLPQYYQPVQYHQQPHLQQSSQHPQQIQYQQVHQPQPLPHTQPVILAPQPYTNQYHKNTQSPSQPQHHPASRVGQVVLVNQQRSYPAHQRN